MKYLKDVAIGIVKTIFFLGFMIVFSVFLGVITFLFVSSFIFGYKLLGTV